MPEGGDIIDPPGMGPVEFGASGGLGQSRANGLKVEDNIKALAMCIAEALRDALLPPAPGLQAGEQSGSISTKIRKAVAPLRMASIESLVARLDQAITTEIGLRSDLARFEYRAIVAEKEARRAEERFTQRDENRSQEVHLLRQVVADLESQIERLTTENGNLDELVSQLRHQENELKDTVSSFAASRWVKMGTRFGLSQLHRHIDQTAPRDET